MTITLGDTTLVASQTRNSSGNPVGPSDLRMSVTPGVIQRECVGADRIQPEHIRCDSGSVSFGATRTFATEAAALAYIGGTMLTEVSEGELKFDGTRVFGPKSAVTQRTAALVGRTVHINYTITG